jgi:hypothetical protein
MICVFSGNAWRPFSQAHTKFGRNLSVFYCPFENGFGETKPQHWPIEPFAPCVRQTAFWQISTSHMRLVSDRLRIYGHPICEGPRVFSVCLFENTKEGVRFILSLDIRCAQHARLVVW